MDQRIDQMKKFILLFTLLLSAQASAQILAGEVPLGQSSYDLIIELSLTGNFTADSIGLELNCDDALDGWAMLRRGYPAVDAPNSASLLSYGNELEVCIDTTSLFLPYPRYYAMGQPLDCSGNFDWQSGNLFNLGLLGDFGPSGPTVVDSLYIAYRQDGILGWIRLSFDLTDDTELNMQVHTVLMACVGSTAIEPLYPHPTLSLYPNPSDGNNVRIESDKNIQRIEVLDTSGRIITTQPGASQLITPPDAAGTYLVRVIHEDGQQAILPLVRY